MKGTPINFFNNFPIEFYQRSRCFTVCPEQVNLREIYGHDEKYLEISSLIDTSDCRLILFNQEAVPTFTHLLLDNEFYKIKKLFHNEWITEVAINQEEWFPRGKSYFHLSWEIMPMAAINKVHWKQVGF